MSHATGLFRRTPLFEEHKRLGARMVPFAGWEMPLSYAGQLEEHLAVRKGAGIFDVSHMGQVRIAGHGAVDFLQGQVPGDVGALRPGRSRYTQLCNESGGILDDLIVTRLGEEEFFAVVNAARRETVLGWLRGRAELHWGDTSVLDESDGWAMIAVQGPRALGILEELLHGTSWHETSPFSFHWLEGPEGPFCVSRTGYTGEAGAEILCAPDAAKGWWNGLLEAGAVPCGLAARDSLRLEAGFCLYGQDLDEETTPVEAGLGWSMGWKKKESWPGRARHERQREEKPERRLVAVKSGSRRPLRAGDEILSQGKEPVGKLTSGGYSPMLECGIGLGYVLFPFVREEGFLVAGRGGPVPVSKVRPPFVRTSPTN